MTTNVTKTGTSYKFEIVEEEYVFFGTCENNLTNIHINSDIRSIEANQEAVGNDLMPHSGISIGSFNYNRNESNVEFNTNIYDRAAFNDVFAVVLKVINAIIEEITK